MNMENITVQYCHINAFKKLQYDGITHTKELPYLSVVQSTEGRYSFGIGGQEQKELNCGEYFIAPALTRQVITHHTDPLSGYMSARWVFLDVVVNNNIPFDLAFTLPVFPNKELSGKIDLIFDSIFSANGIIERKIGCYRLLNLLLPFAVERTENASHINAAVYYIQQHFKEHITVAEVANSVNMSQPNLYRLFKSAMHTSPIQYCNSLRLSYACMLLEQSTYSIEKIAVECGIKDPFYFSKLFKNKFGVSPLMYRSSL